MDMPASSGFSAWKLGATGFLVLLNGFFVSAEFALVKARAARIEAKARRGSRSAGVVAIMLSDLNLYLSACQLGITLASLALGWLAEPAVASLLISAADGVGLDSHGSQAVHVVALILALTIITLLHMIIGEQVPKIYAIRKSEPVALFSAYPLWLFAALLRPFIWVVNVLSNKLLRLFGIRDVDGHEESHDVEELRSLLQAASRAGHISARQRTLGENVLGLVRLEVRHIMVPRVDIVYLTTAASQQDTLKLIREATHSRFPLCNKDLDDIVGMIHGKDVLAAMIDNAGDPQALSLVSLARPVLSVPDTLPIPRLIVAFQQGQGQFAVVIDEHGTTVGVVFLEDALEEIVGPLHDEFDSKARWVENPEKGVTVMSGSLPLPDAADILGIDSGTEEDTVGGWVTAQLGRLPVEGEQFDAAQYHVTILSMSKRRVARVRFEAKESGD